MQILINLHSYLAYVVLAMLVIAVVNAVIGLAGKKMFTLERDFRISLFALIISHIQLLIGLLVYFLSPNGLQAIRNLGMGGLTASARLLALEHPIINILAIALITIGWSRHKKFLEGNLKFRSIALFYGLGLLLLLSRIPWALWFN
ncbi:hypothetical protein N9L94_04095 [Robiginitalea sp.]|jgi:uncharacterized membrane protein|nr:hypothetical protein [Robiginitalea sp.]